MSKKMITAVAATTIALPLLGAAAPAASAAAPVTQPTTAAARTATPVLGSVAICVPVGIVTICI
ncbi:hypothetical protein [Nocardia miyunensis]|uniref:hypothetical protein n=1 Tax=Nocardia miyunensis TaxID=282684 RepID=UPI000A930CDD|nr:hypothetical protein [Nocardia miyunensis]